MKKGISLITLMVAIVLMFIISSVVMYNVIDKETLKNVSEIKFKTELKNFDYEIRSKMSANSMTGQEMQPGEVITEKNEISLYSPGLVDSIYSSIAYIADSRLVLYGKDLTPQQKEWALEADIKVDDTVLLTSQVAIELETDEWVSDGIAVRFTYPQIPTGYVIQFKVGDASWQDGTQTYLTENKVLQARLYHKKLLHSTAQNIEYVRNIDKTPPTVATAITSTEDFYKMTIRAVGAIDTQSGLKGYKYSLDGETWTHLIGPDETYTIENIKSSTTYNIHVKSVDNALNESETTLTAKTREIPGPIIRLDSNDWTTGRVDFSIEHSNIPEGYRIQYSIGNGNSYRYGTSDSVTENCKIYARLYNEEIDDSSKVTIMTIDKIDSKAPSNPKIKVKRNINSIEVTGTESIDEGIGLEGYKYSIDNINWTSVMTNTMIFDKIMSNSNVTVYVIAVDRLGNESDVVSEEVGAVTITDSVVIESSPETWYNHDVKITMSYDNMPDNFVLQYSLTSNSNDWHDYESEFYLSQNSTVYARLYNKDVCEGEVCGDEIATNSLDITNIDKELPEAPTDIEVYGDFDSLTVKAIGGEDGLSGVKGYQYSVDGIKWTKTINKENSYIITPLTSGTTYTVYARTVDNAGNISDENKTVNASTE